MSYNSMERLDSKECLLAYRIMLDPIPDAIAFVENERDTFFWKYIFRSFCKTLKIRIRNRYSEKLPNGKQELLKLAKKGILCKEIIICVDSDYDNILKNTDCEIIKNSRPFVFQTYVYSIENYYCLAESLELLIVRLTSCDSCTFDIFRFMREYSNTVYKLFIHSIYHEKRNSGGKITLTRKNLGEIISINQNPSITQNGHDELQNLKEKVDKEFERLNKYCDSAEFERIENGLSEHGINRDNTYLFIKGKYILKVVINLLNVITTELIRSKVNELSNLSNNEERLKQKLLEYAKSHGLNDGLQHEKDFICNTSRKSYIDYLKDSIASAKLNLEDELMKNLNIDHLHYPLMQKIKQDIDEYTKHHSGE